MIFNSFVFSFGNLAAQQQQLTAQQQLRLRLWLWIWTVLSVFFITYNGLIRYRFVFEIVVGKSDSYSCSIGSKNYIDI